MDVDENDPFEVPKLMERITQGMLPVKLGRASVSADENDREFVCSNGEK